MKVRITQSKVKIEILKGMRWFFFCWIWMFSSFIVSPLFHSYDDLDGKMCPFAVLCLLILTLPYLICWLGGWLDYVGQIATIVWILHLLSPVAQIIFQLSCFPVLVFEELVLLGSMKRIPMVSCLYVLPLLITHRNDWSFFLLLEAIFFMVIISYAAYIGIGRRFNQAEELLQTNIKLNQANSKIAKLTSQKVRQEVARDLHDTLTQDIVGINMQLAVVKMLADKQDYAKMKLMLDKTEKMASDTIRESRELIKQYRSVNEDNPRRSLKQALLRTSHDLEDNYGLQTELAIDQDILIDSAELHDIIQVVSEALMNVVKHAHTNQATVETMVDDQTLTVMITDHGSLFKPGVILNNHYGIKNIKERAEKYGGKAIVNQLTNGVRVVATFPLKEEKS